MHVLVILALALLLAGCNGDRIKQGMNVPQELSLNFGDGLAGQAAAVMG
jgi:hypothetical protein